MDDLEHLRQRILDGDKDAIMDAIYIRVREVGPAWLSEAFSEVYEAVRALEIRGWDAALGEPNKGKHLLKSRLKRFWAIPVWSKKKGLQCSEQLGIHRFERTVTAELCDAVERVDLLELREEMWRIINEHAAVAGIEIRDGDVGPLKEKLTSNQLEKLQIDLKRLVARAMPANL
jgi:hypothetical protein